MKLRLGPNRSTYTIIGYCSRTQRLGIGIATFSLAVGGYCPRVERGVGAVASQAYADPRLIPQALHLLRNGRTPAETLVALARIDPYFGYRQIGLVDARGDSAAHTGAKAAPWKGHLCGTGYVAMGNCLAGGNTVAAIAEGFLAEPERDLEERLLMGLEAGKAAGGQSPPMNERSAALIVYEHEDYARVDLRVDVHNDAIAELRSAYEAYLPYIPLYYELRVKRPDLAPSQLEWIRDHP